jgi:hypothetical protein
MSIRQLAWLALLQWEAAGGSDVRTRRMAILKDAILSIVIAVVAIIGAKALGWAWYILGLLWLGQ